MSNREEQLGMLGLLSGDPVVGAMGEQLLEKARTQAQESKRRVHIGNGFIMAPDGTVSQDPSYGKFLREQQTEQNSAQMQRMLAAAQIEQSAPQYSVSPTDWGPAILQTNPRAKGGARLASHINLPPSIGPGARQKAAEAERLAAEAVALRGELDRVKVHKPGVDIPSDWLRQSGVTRGLAPSLERQFYDEDELAVRTRGNRFEQNLSNLAAGLALTGYEIAERQKWSPFAPGINSDEAKARLENVARDFTSRAGSIRGIPQEESQPEQDTRIRKTLRGVTYVEVAPGEWEVEGE